MSLRNRIGYARPKAKAKGQGQRWTLDMSVAVSGGGDLGPEDTVGKSSALPECSEHKVSLMGSYHFHRPASFPSSPW